MRINSFVLAKVWSWVVNVFNFSDFSPILQYLDDVRLEKQSLVNPGLCLNWIKLPVKLNPN